MKLHSYFTYEKSVSDKQITVSVTEGCTEIAAVNIPINHELPKDDLARYFLSLADKVMHEKSK